MLYSVRVLSGDRVGNVRIERLRQFYNIAENAQKPSLTKHPYTAAALWPFPPNASSTSAAEEYLPSGALICAPCTSPRTATNISRATATPSARAASAFVAADIRARIESGTDTLNSFFMNSAL